MRNALIGRAGSFSQYYIIEFFLMYQFPGFLNALTKLCCSYKQLEKCLHNEMRTYGRGNNNDVEDRMMSLFFFMGWMDR